MVSGLHVCTGDVMCVYMCVGRGVLLNKYVCVHVYMCMWRRDVCMYMCMHG